MEANQAIVKYISRPQPVVTIGTIKPYNDFFKQLFYPICLKPEKNVNANANVNTNFEEY